MPPNHDLFDSFPAERKGKISHLLELRKEAKKKEELLKNQQPQQPQLQLQNPLQALHAANMMMYAPFSHLPFSASSFGSLAPPTGNASSFNHTVTGEALIPQSHSSGLDLDLTQFCAQYMLTDSLLNKLTGRGFQRTLAFEHTTVEKLEKAGFLEGEVAELKRAIKAWAIPKN